MQKLEFWYRVYFYINFHTSENIGLFTNIFDFKKSANLCRLVWVLFDLIKVIVLKLNSKYSTLHFTPHHTKLLIIIDSLIEWCMELLTIDIASYESSELWVSLRIFFKIQLVTLFYVG
jgi:hypothetical protein